MLYKLQIKETNGNWLNVYNGQSRLVRIMCDPAMLSWLNQQCKGEYRWVSAY